jgi:outer membrane protein TolC
MTNISSSRLTLTIAGLIGISLLIGFPISVRAQVDPIAASTHLTLPQAVDMALTHSSKLELARLAVQERKEQTAIARSQYFPKLDNVSTVDHITQLEGVVLPAGAFSSNTTTGQVPSQTVRIDQGANTSYESITRLAQPITQVLKSRASVQAARADLASAKIQQTDQEHAISLQVHQLYYSCLIERLTAESARDLLVAAEANDREAQKGVDEGKLLGGTALSSRAAVLSRKKAVLDSRLSLNGLELKLDDLLGLPLGTKLDLDADALGEPPKIPSREQALIEVLDRSPSILAAQQNIKKAEASLVANREEYIPNITGFAHYDYQSGIPFLKHNFGSYGVDFNYNLFDGGARQAKLRDAKIMLSVAETRLVQTRNDVRIEISNAYDKLDELTELQLVTKQLLDARTEGYRIAAQRLHADAALPSAAADSLAAQTAAKVDLLSAQMNLYLAQYNITKLLGALPR